ncbi:unnamed protein product [Owenia fusiformis]|uniref:Ubiquitin-like domain-containing protein n=1 Tax=Owenia fusiformis TaxID=6347 RepID=A0A8S4N2U7_OWEFU|nr:unnamed protein product [Owenia fusiformis]
MVSINKMSQSNEQGSSNHNKCEEGEYVESKTEEKEKMDDKESEEDTNSQQCLTHVKAMSLFKDGLADLITSDPLTFDLPTEVTLEEINSLIALEHGQSMMVNVRRGDNSVLPVVVVQAATVLDLKNAMKRHLTLKQKREGGTSHISWRYIWKTYWLIYQGEKLQDDTKELRAYGIRNRDEVTFMKRLKER